MMSAMPPASTGLPRFADGTHAHVAGGYTLIELTIALAMAAIVSTAGLSVFAVFNRHRVRIERASTADDVAKSVLQYLIRESQRVGGGALRPWQSIAVEQDPCGEGGPFTIPCEDDLPHLAGPPRLGTDRVTFAFADDSAVFTSCSIAAMDVNTITLDSVVHAGQTACCNQFRFDDVGAVVVAPIATLANKHLMLSSTGTAGTTVEIFKAITYSSTLSASGASCKFAYTESAQALPLSSEPRPAPSAFAFTSSIGFTKLANAIPITIATAYIGCSVSDCATHPEDRALFLFADRNGGASTNAVLDATDDNFVISPNVIDLQLSLGYDNNGDGEVVESETGENDDFGGNASGIVPDTGFFEEGSPPGDVTLPNPRLMRMLRIGVVSAIKVNDPNYTTSAHIPGGVEHSGVGLHLRAMSTKAAFRSLNLLE